MNAVDLLLQRWRIARVRPYVPPGARVLDIGCARGELFQQLGSVIGEGIGIDPILSQPIRGSNFRLIAGSFPRDLDDPGPFDVITLLAVVEHVRREQQPELAAHSARVLKPGGRLLVTVPSRLTDPILALLKFVRVIDGMCLEQHYGYRPSETPSLFSVDRVALTEAKTFQLGLNNLFVFQKATDAALKTGLKQP